MNTVKKVVIVLSVFCYIAIALYAVCAIPMLFGYKPMPITDDHLGSKFPVGSMFYYHKEDISEMQSGYVAVYKENGERLTGFIVSAEYAAVDICSNVTYENGKYNYLPSDVKTISTSYVEGINKSINIPLIGYFLYYVQNHVAVIVIIGVILALRILFIYIDPKKKESAGDSPDMQDSYELSLGGLIDNAETSENSEEDIESIFAKSVSDAPESEPKEDPVSFESILGESDNEIPLQLKDESDIDIDAVLSAREEKTAESRDDSEVKEMKKEDTPDTSASNATSVLGASEITDYINALTFDSSKDGIWYNATQVDEALDMITAKVYDALNAARNSNASFDELYRVRDEKAELEKKYLEKDAALTSASDKLAEANKRLAEYERDIANYKIMEQKVAKLVAALKAGKQNG